MRLGNSKYHRRHRDYCQVVRLGSTWVAVIPRRPLPTNPGAAAFLEKVQPAGRLAAGKTNGGFRQETCRTLTRGVPCPRLCVDLVDELFVGSDGHARPWPWRPELALARTAT